MAGKRPAYNITVKSNTDPAGKYHLIGVAWRHDNGSITLKLNPFVDLARIDPDDHFTLFPLDKKPHSKKAAVSHEGHTSGSPDDDYGDSDVPF